MSLLPKVAAVFITNVSIKTLAYMTADQLAAAAKGNSRHAADTAIATLSDCISGGDPEKPFNMLGNQRLLPGDGPAVRVDEDSPQGQRRHCQFQYQRLPWKRIVGMCCI